MLFNSLQFVFFYIIVTFLFWYFPHRNRWLLLLAASCYFYMAFVPKYLLILGFTIVVDYIAGICLERLRNHRTRKFFLICSLVSNIGVLAVFKYYNFFNQTLADLLSNTSHQTPFPYLNFLLPIGLSFHTFQAMSYIIEVYRGNQKAEKNFGIYALYVMFYPQLVAGPIERPQNVLHQFHTPRKFDFDNLKAGLMQMAFGLFKKVVIADRLAEIVDEVYARPDAQNGETVLLATFLYSFQIYCDFSGYSDIGIGAARTMGFTLMKNFNVPYLATSIAKFWARWHISLSTWFRDYLYIPLGGNRVSRMRNYYNLGVVFLISGLWHGANWTFIVWGAIHAFYLITEIIIKQFTDKRSIRFPANFLTRSLQSLFTFCLVTIAWIFFRSPNLRVAFTFIKKICHASLRDHLLLRNTSRGTLVFSFILIGFLLVKERYYLTIPTRSTVTFGVLFATLLLCCYLFGVFNHTQFIYFQF